LSSENGIDQSFSYLFMNGLLHSPSSVKQTGPLIKANTAITPLYRAPATPIAEKIMDRNIYNRQTEHNRLKSR